MTRTDTRQLWQNTLGELQLQMRPEDFRTWFRNTHLLAYDGDRCIVGTENPFNVEWLSSKCTGLVSRTLQSIIGNPVNVEFVVGRPEPPSPAPPPLRLSPPPSRRAGRTNRRSQPLEDEGPAISPRYTFDTFVVGSNNGLAHAASISVAERPGQVHNPLFIYGGVGLGKTHLLHAIGHRALARGLEVVYVSSETFMNEFIDSIKQGRMDEFRAKYRRCRVLLIDDIQFLAGKEQTQEEFFHTFNAVYQASGQIVISSDRHPRAITTLEDRLRSRFVWGLMTDIQQPDLETRTAILRRKMAEAKQVGGSGPAPNDVLDFIAQKVPSNIRELEGALNRVLAYADLIHAPVTVELASLALNEMLESAGRRAVAPDAVVRAVCRAMNVSRQDMTTKARDRRVLVPRQIAMYLLREETDLSLSEVGALFGGRDHSTVLHSCEKITTELERNERLRASVRSAREALAQGA
jgi:chromosomal replication initiator protein